MRLPSLRAICAVAVALCFCGLRTLASEKSVSIDSVPPGAQVEVNGNVTCTTPCSIQVASHYFGKKHTAFSSHGTEPIHVKLTKQGYAPKSADLTTGPHHWSSVTGVAGYDYYLMSSDHFTFQLEAVAAAPGATPSPEAKAPAPPASAAIVLASPAGVTPNQTVESKESPLIIRGVATDSAGILLVTVNGSTANMRPQNAQATEFWSDPLQLKPGDTPIEITASNSAHVETKLAFTLHYAPNTTGPLTKHQIISLLQGDVPSARIRKLVKDRGVAFTPSAGDLNEIRQAGGTAELVKAIQQAAPPK